MSGVVPIRVRTAYVMLVIAATVAVSVVTLEVLAGWP